MAALVTKQGANSFAPQNLFKKVELVCYNLKIYASAIYQTFLRIALLVISTSLPLYATAKGLFKIQTEHTTGYLIGSMHVGNDALFPLDPRYEEKVRHSAVLATEAPVGTAPAWQKLIASKMKLERTEKLEDYITIETFNHAISIIKFRNIVPIPTVARLSQFHPFILYQLLLSVTHSDSQAILPGTDFYLNELADKYKLRKFILEDPENLAQSLKSLSREEMEILMRACMSMLEDRQLREENFQHQRRLATLVKNGNFDEVSRIDFDYMSSRYGWTSEIYKKLITSRNEALARQVMELTKIDKAFIAVIGASHLLGQQGVVNTLRSAGYCVTEE